MARAGRRHDQLRCFWKGVDHEMLVRCVGEQTSCEPKRRTVRIREHVPDAFTKGLLVCGCRLTGEFVRMAGFMKMMIEPDLKAGDTPGWELVEVTHLAQDVRDREHLGPEEIRLL